MSNFLCFQRGAAGGCLLRPAGQPHDRLLQEPAEPQGEAAADAGVLLAAQPASQRRE